MRRELYEREKERRKAVIQKIKQKQKKGNKKRSLEKIWKR